MSQRLLRLHRHARAIFSAAVDAVEPRRIIERTITVQRAHDTHILTITPPQHDDRPTPLTFTFNAATIAASSSYSKLLVISVGKCAYPMALAAEHILGALIADGVCLTKHGHVPHDAPPLAHMRLFTGGHPIPDRAGADAAEHICDVLDANRNAATLILLLLSGGSSALLTYPMPNTNIQLADIQSASQTLQSCGADITELNAIRKHHLRHQRRSFCTTRAPRDRRLTDTIRCRRLTAISHRQRTDRSGRIHIRRL